MNFAQQGCIKLIKNMFIMSQKDFFFWIIKESRWTDGCINTYIHKRRLWKPWKKKKKLLRTPNFWLIQLKIPSSLQSKWDLVYSYIVSPRQQWDLTESKCSLLLLRYFSWKKTIPEVSNSFKLKSSDLLSTFILHQYSFSVLTIDSCVYLFLLKKHLTQRSYLEWN